MIQTEPLNTCVEIMTGARFPEVAHPHLDSVVKVEDVVVSEHWSASDSSVSRYIEIVRPVKSSQHRRPAGSDFQAGDRIIEGKAVIVPKHVAALASLGFTEIEVVNEDPESRSQPSRQRRDMALRIGVLSTGSEVRADASRQASDTSKQAIPDSNGPYLVSTLRRCCPDAEVEYLGVASDSTAELARKLDQAVLQGQFDVVITSGGVSKGRHDLVRYVVETVLSGEVIFHGVKIRPGAPVLFALLCGGNSTRPSNTHRTAFFGAPGNPLAAAVALRFFVMPYLQHLNSSDGGHRPQLVSYTGKMAVVSSRRDTPTPSLARLKPTDSTCFWLAKHRANKVGSVEIVDDQASYKLRGLLEADCWVTASAGQSEVFIGQSLPMCAL